MRQSQPTQSYRAHAPESLPPMPCGRGSNSPGGAVRLERNPAGGQEGFSSKLKSNLIPESHAAGFSPTPLCKSYSIDREIETAVKKKKVTLHIFKSLQLSDWDRAEHCPPRPHGLPALLHLPLTQSSPVSSCCVWDKGRPSSEPPAECRRHRAKQSQASSWVPRKTMRQ